MALRRQLRIVVQEGSWLDGDFLCSLSDREEQNA
jgi:hypothetical protein